jgi:hypothetical protein
VSIACAGTSEEGLRRMNIKKDESCSLEENAKTNQPLTLLRRLWDSKLGTNISFSSDGKTKVVNRSLGNILRILVSEHPKQWDQVPVQVEFSYNDSPNKSTVLVHFRLCMSSIQGVFMRKVLILR